MDANNELKNIIKSLFKCKSKAEIENYIAIEHIEWHFNPPSSPHFGGLWKARGLSTFFIQGPIFVKLLLFL